MNNIKTVTLRCNDGGEACVLKKFTFEIVNDFNPTWFEFAIEDDYVGGDYKGFFGRLKRAWKGFIGKPVVYTGICCDNKEQIQKFLEDCLALIKEDGESFEIECKSQSVVDETISQSVVDETISQSVVDETISQSVVDETIKEAFSVIREAMLREKE